MADPVVDPLNWVVYDRTTYDRVQVVETIRSATFIPRFNAIGTWQMDLAPTPENLALLRTDDNEGVHHDVELVYLGGGQFSRRTVMFGPITSIERSHSARGDTLTLSGTDHLVWLDRRLAVPDHFPGPTEAPNALTGTAWVGAAPWDQLPFTGRYSPFSHWQLGTVQTGTPAQTLTQIVRDQVGQNAPAARRPPGFWVAPTIGIPGPQIAPRFRYENVLECCQAIALQNGTEFPFGFRVDLRAEAQYAHAFDLYTPATSRAVFSEEFGTLNSWKYEYHADDLNVAYVLGQGEMEQRQVVICQGYGRPGFRGVFPDLPSVSPWGRVERLRDRRDTNDWNLLRPAAVDDCLKGINHPQVTVAANSTEAQQYSRDFNLGDVVEVRLAPGEAYRDQITEIHISLQSQGGITVTPIVGRAGSAYVGLDVFRRLNSVEREVAGLTRGQ